MTKILLTAIRSLRFDNLKSKACGEQRRTIQKRPRRLKWLGLSVIAFVLALWCCGPRSAADGKFRGLDISLGPSITVPAPVLRRSARVCAILATSRGKTLSLSGDTAEGNSDRVPGARRRARSSQGRRYRHDSVRQYPCARGSDVDDSDCHGAGSRSCWLRVWSQVWRGREETILGWQT